MYLHAEIALQDIVLRSVMISISTYGRRTLLKEKLHNENQTHSVPLSKFIAHVYTQILHWKGSCCRQWRGATAAPRSQQLAWSEPVLLAFNLANQTFFALNIVILSFWTRVYVPFGNSMWTQQSETWWDCNGIHNELLQLRFSILVLIY